MSCVGDVARRRVVCERGLELDWDEPDAKYRVTSRRTLVLRMLRLYVSFERIVLKTRSVLATFLGSGRSAIRSSRMAF